MAEEQPAPEKKKGGRPFGTTKKNKDLKHSVEEILTKHIAVIKEALNSDTLTLKEKAALMRDFLPYGASKKTEDKKEIPDSMKYLKLILVQGYTPDQNPFEEEEENTGNE